MIVRHGSGTIITPPDRRKAGGRSVFLAGSIESGKAEDWQKGMSLALSADGITVCNPRRADWDSAWDHDVTTGSPFETQVSWELDHIEKADLVAMNIKAGTVSPITLLELGIILATRKPVIIRCEDGYFRKGNVVITARRYGVAVLGDEADLLDEVRKAFLVR